MDFNPQKQQPPATSKYVKTAEQSDGYKNPNQSILDYVLIELEGSMKGACSPSRGAKRLTREWQEVYESGKFGAISGAVIGLGGAAGLIAMGLSITTPIVAFAGISGLVSSLFIRHHAEGAANCATEHSFLELHPELLKSLTIATQNGLPADVALTVYETCLKKFTQKTDTALPPQIIERVFTDAVNGALSGYKTSANSANAFVSGEPLPDDRAMASQAWDDDEDLDDDEDDFDDDDGYGFAVPAFLKPSSQAVTPSPKHNGAAMASPIAAPTARPLVTRLVLNSKGFMLCRLFVGASRVGKSQLVSDAGTQARLLFPKAQIFVVSASYKTGEDDRYWRFADHVAAYNFIDFPATGDTTAAYLQAYSHFAAILKAFDLAPYSEKAPKILICDELNSLMDGRDSSDIATKFCGEVANRFKMAGSGGSKHGFITWGISPVGDVKSLNLTRSEMSVFQPVFIGAVGEDWNDLVYSTARTNYLAPNRPPIGYNEGDRVIGIGGRWEKMPPAGRLSETIQDCRVSPPTQPNEGLDLAMDMIAKATIATTFEIPGTIHPDGTKAPLKADPDPVWEVLNSQPDGEHKMALMIAYKWHLGRQQRAVESNFAAFKNRATSEKDCAYLRLNYKDVWDDLQKLLG